MIQVNKKHSVQYKNGYFILALHGKDKKGIQYNKRVQTYPSLEAMVLQCGFDMGFEYADAALKSKANYITKESTAFVASKSKKESKKLAIKQ